MELKEFLDEAGIPSDRLLERFCGNEPMLKKFLLRFPSDETFAALKESVAREDLPGMERNAHTLKGISANLGFERLSLLCGNMVSAAREGQGRRACELFLEVEREYDMLVAGIQRIV